MTVQSKMHFSKFIPSKLDFRFQLFVFLHRFSMQSYQHLEWKISCSGQQIEVKSIRNAIDFGILKIVHVTNSRIFCSGLKHCWHLFNCWTARDREHLMVFMQSMHNLRNYGFEIIIHVTHLWSQHIDQGFFLYIYFIGVVVIAAVAIIIVLNWPLCIMRQQLNRSIASR